MRDAVVGSGLLITLLLAGCGRPAPPPPPDPATPGAGFIPRTYRDSAGQASQYLVYVPPGYAPAQPCPTILFLHGAGQTGTDGVAPAQGGLGDAIRERTAAVPCLVVFPQSHAGSWRADSADGQRALAILRDVASVYHVDRRRTYLTGYSMGGEGVWSLAAAHPELFAAIVPICPGQHRAGVEALKSIPCWCFQGARDASSRVQDTRSMVLALQTAGGRPIYQEYPDLEHNCWDAAYRDPNLFEWLLHQTLPAGE